MITVVGHAPSVTGASTTELTQTTSGLVILPNALDGAIGFFQITGAGFADGTLFLNNGTTAIAANGFITAAQASLGLRFTPSAGFGTGSASFTVQESASSSATGSDWSHHLGHGCG